MQTSETIAEIAGALSKAQGELANTTKDQRAIAGKARYTYANIAAVLDDVRPVLARHGLAVVQAVGKDGGDVLVTTRIMHQSGEWIESALPLPVDRMGGIQGVGSAITYGRRYGLQAMLGIASDDDDGAAAQQQRPRPRPARTLAQSIEAARQAMGDAWPACVEAHGDPSTWTEATLPRVREWYAARRAGGEE